MNFQLGRYNSLAIHQTLLGQLSWTRRREILHLNINHSMAISTSARKQNPSSSFLTYTDNQTINLLINLIWTVVFTPTSVLDIFNQDLLSLLKAIPLNKNKKQNKNFPVSCPSEPQIHLSALISSVCFTSMHLHHWPFPHFWKEHLSYCSNLTGTITVFQTNR